MYKILCIIPRMEAQQNHVWCALHAYIHVCVCVWLLRTCIAACRCPRVYI